jgi:hypothetical protein
MSWTPKYKKGQCFNLETPFPEFPEYPYEIIDVDLNYNVYVLDAVDFPYKNSINHLRNIWGPDFDDENRTPIECERGFRPRGGRKSRRNKNRHSRRRSKTHSRRRR